MNKMAIITHVIFRPRNAIFIYIKKVIFVISKTLFLLFLRSGKPMIFEKKIRTNFMEQGIDRNKTWFKKNVFFFDQDKMVLTARIRKHCWKMRPSIKTVLVKPLPEIWKILLSVSEWLRAS